MVAEMVSLLAGFAHHPAVSCLPACADTDLHLAV